MNSVPPFDHYEMITTYINDIVLNLNGLYTYPVHSLEPRQDIEENEPNQEGQTNN